MKRKYLDDLGIKDRHNLWNPNDNRQSIWQRQRREYGFDERETWSLDSAFYLWLYERLKMYLEYASRVVNLDFFSYCPDNRRNKSEREHFRITICNYVCQRTFNCYSRWNYSRSI